MSVQQIALRYPYWLAGRYTLITNCPASENIQFQVNLTLPVNGRSMEASSSWHLQATSVHDQGNLADQSFSPVHVCSCRVWSSWDLLTGHKSSLVALWRWHDLKSVEVSAGILYGPHTRTRTHTRTHTHTHKDTHTYTCTNTQWHTPHTHTQIYR